MKPYKKTIILIKDLILKSKVAQAASSDNLSITYARDEGSLTEKLRDGNFDLVVLDLNLLGGGIGPLIKDLKVNFPKVEILCFCSHVNKEHFEAAIEAGADKVLPRSKFFGDVSSWLST